MKLKLNNDKIIAVAIQFAIIAVDGYDIAGVLSYFGQNLPCLEQVNNPIQMGGAPWLQLRHVFI